MILDSNHAHETNAPLLAVDWFEHVWKDCEVLLEDTTTKISRKSLLFPSSLNSILKSCDVRLVHEFALSKEAVVLHGNSLGPSYQLSRYSQRNFGYNAV